MGADFSGWATKNDIKCSDGRTIKADAFKHQDKIKVPLVWQHRHGEPENILGHAILENRPEGVYTYGYFNDSPQGLVAKRLVKHKDIDQLSIFANQLVEKSKQVLHGFIKEVSLVIAGANPGAFIDVVSLQHEDGSYSVIDDEAIIYTGLEFSLEHGDKEGEDMADDETVKDVFDTLTDKQKQAVYFMMGQALEHSDLDEDDDEDEVEDDVLDDSDDEEEEPETDAEGNIIQHSKEGLTVSNVFEQQGDAVTRATLTHDQLTTIVNDAHKMGSFKESFLMHAGEYGITNIDMLFPDAKDLTNSPDFVKRRTEWVSRVLGGTKHSPFARIRTRTADITLDTARAKGYVTATLKKEEFFALTQRVTTPATIYKKQKLDRDDMIDITDLDVVAWLKAEMRLMLDEEIARAVLIGDGREVDDEDKIKDPGSISDGAGIRSILHDDDFYAKHINVAAGITAKDLITTFITSMDNYRGAGNPTLFTSRAVLSSMVLVEDTLGRRLYNNKTELADAIGVESIVDVEVFNSEPNLKGIIVNLQDYTLGTNAGGEVSMFDDFDIDYNQYKYLIETRLSGSLTKWLSAVVVQTNPGTLATPAVPTFVSGTGVVTIPTVTGVVYKDATTGTTLTPGAQTALASGASLKVDADPAAGYYFPFNFDDDWTFTRP